jgi:hypothetical protein
LTIKPVYCSSGKHQVGITTDNNTELYALAGSFGSSPRRKDAADRLHKEKDLTEAFGLGFNVKAVKVIEESSDSALSASASRSRRSLTASQRLSRKKDLTELVGRGF